MISKYIAGNSYFFQMETRWKVNLRKINGNEKDLPYLITIYEYRYVLAVPTVRNV